MLARDVWIDGDGFVCEYTVDWLAHRAATNCSRAVPAPVTFDWSTIPDSPREALRPFVCALAGLLLADLLRYPPSTV